MYKCVHALVWECKYANSSHWLPTVELELQCHFYTFINQATINNCHYLFLLEVLASYMSTNWMTSSWIAGEGHLMLATYRVPQSDTSPINYLVWGCVESAPWLIHK